MCYTIISTIIFIYYGESIGSRELTNKFQLLILLPYIIVVLVITSCSAVSSFSITDEKINNTINICCSNSTYSSKCDFMEKYGCESFNITSNEFNYIKTDSISICFLFIILCGFAQVFI